MKKMLFFALAAAGMLSACSNEDNLGGNGEQASTPKIQLGVSNSVGVTTRGTGTVGDLDGGNNVWAGQELFVYMLNKGEMGLACYVSPDGQTTTLDGAVFDNEKFNAPVGEASAEAKTQSGKIAYYPVSGNFDFWGYRVDDATQGTPYMVDAEGNTTTDETEAVKRVVDVKIDGSQDIMTGKAALVNGDVDKLGAYPENYYSAYAARKEVQPNISFNHNLTRFTFEVRAGSKGTCGQIANGDVADAVRVTGISVKSKTDGKLTVAYTADNAPESVLEFPGNFEDVATALKLKQRSTAGETDHNVALVDLQEVPLTWDDDNNQADVIKVGEALLVAPGETEYPFTVDLKQVVKTNEDGTTDELSLQQNTKIVMDGVKTFEAGKSYKVTITVYGVERIVVTATLVPWQDGGSIDIDDDREENPIYTPGN